MNEFIRESIDAVDKARENNLGRIREYADLSPRIAPDMDIITNTDNVSYQCFLLFAAMNSMFIHLAIYSSLQLNVTDYIWVSDGLGRYSAQVIKEKMGGTMMLAPINGAVGKKVDWLFSKFNDDLKHLMNKITVRRGTSTHR